MNTITVGGVLVGLLAAAIVVVPWWRKGGGAKPADPLAKGPAKSSKGRNWKALGPFGSALSFGTLCALCTGGLLGQAAHRLGQGSDTLGDKLLSTLTGSNSPAVSHQGLAMLQPGGAVVLILLMVGIIIWWRGSGRTMRRDMLLGLLSGITLGPTAGLAGLAGLLLAPAANQVGAWVVGLL
ncbi:hypothetical protein [Streptacidiphilus rugosus]|uniref:hypothetical protein n=1 Tax=Streptacidiphilus rugosus TaxID=405783 RepID=UPI0005622F4C|nr:hypothetical protein [Streptacidiphilus rugosus]